MRIPSLEEVTALEVEVAALRAELAHTKKLLAIEVYRRTNEYTFDRVIDDDSFRETEQLLGCWRAERLAPLLKEVDYETLNTYMVEEMHKAIAKEEKEEQEEKDADCE